jgi:hypothetical protein
MENMCGHFSSCGKLSVNLFILNAFHTLELLSATSTLNPPKSADLFSTSAAFFHERDKKQANTALHKDA